MAYVKPLYGHEVLIEVAPDATSTTFTKPALINTSRGVNWSTSVEEDDLVDLEDQSKPAQKFRRVSGTDLTIDGAGMVHVDDIDDFVEWMMEGQIRNVRVTAGGVTLTGPFVLASFSISGDRMKATECSISLQQAGVLVQS